MKTRRATPEEMVAFFTELRARAREGRCIRCGASGKDDPGCSSHDWPWNHGYMDPPQWAIDAGEVYEESK